jgi:hypothetical protein
MGKREDYSIIENKIIKQELKKLIDYSTKLIAQKEIVETDKTQIINEATSILKKSSRRIRRKVNESGIENLDSSIIKDLIKEINDEINQKNDEILKRKPFLMDKLQKNNANKHLVTDKNIVIMLELKIFARFYQKGINYSGGKVSVHIGSGKIPEDKRPSILLKGYKFLNSNNEWVGPQKTKSIYCDIFNSSITIKEQMILLKAINEILGSRDINEEETELVIIGNVNTDKITNIYDIDLIGVPRPNSEYRDYEFHFNKIHNIYINKNQYLLKSSDSYLADELSTLLLPHDEKVQGFQEKIEQLELEKQLVLKLKLLTNQKNSIEKDAERYNSIAKKAEALLKLSMFNGIENTTMEPLLPTQLFLHDPYYKQVWKSLKSIDDIIGASLIPGRNDKRIGIRKVNEIFEVWSLLKMISILTEKMGWSITNKRRLIDCIDAFLKLKKELKGFLVNLELEDFLLEISYEPKVDFQGDKFSKKPDYRLLFKQRTFLGYIQELGVVYLDAKYRNYKEQDMVNNGEKEWKKDIIETAINNYGNKPHKDNPNLKTLASFILHPDIILGMEKETKGENYFAFYNRKLFPGVLERQIPEEVHKYGSIYILPSSTHSFVNWFKMLMEYRINKHEVCWSCGNLKEITRETKFTGKGYPKYHYQCLNEKCNEYWVKNHCSNKGHKLVKHVNNYHRQPSQDYEWYVVCPTCGDGFNKE